MADNRTAWLILLLSSVLLLGCPKKKPQRTESPGASGKTVERWAGVIHLPMGRRVDVLIAFRRDAGGITATLSVPKQRVYGIPLRDVSYSDTAMGFTLYKPARPKASEVYAVKRKPAKGGTAEGTVTINGMRFKFVLRRLAKGERLRDSMRRPQTPRPPFPYRSHEVVFTNPKDGTRRAGTLSIPKGEGRHPVVIIESGSGAIDRDGTFMGHKFYYVIADYLARHGIASLRVDDRGVGNSTGRERDATYDALVGDMLAAVAMLKKRSDIDGTMIGVMGHSQGASIAPIAASRSKDVAFVIMLCGIGTPGDEVMFTQKKLIMQSLGVSGEQLARSLAVQRKLLNLVKTRPTDAALRSFVEQHYLADIPPEQHSKITPQMRKAIVNTGVAMLTSKPIQELIRTDPQTYLTKVTQPLLAVFGEKDLQVEPRANLAGVKAAMKKGGNKDVTTVVVPKMNHNLQESKTGSMEEYGRIEQTVSPVVLKLLARWIRQRTGLEKKVP